MPNDGTSADDRAKDEIVIPFAVPILRRERWRIRGWATAAVALWSITAVYLVALVLTYVVLVHPAVNELLTGGELSPTTRAEHAAAIIGGLKALCWWPVTLVAAAICTMAFTLATRQATLTQIQAGLTDYRVQLERMTTRP
jgi:hypothetical protein